MYITSGAPNYCLVSTDPHRETINQQTRSVGTTANNTGRRKFKRQTISKTAWWSMELSLVLINSDHSITNQLIQTSPRLSRCMSWISWSGGLLSSPTSQVDHRKISPCFYRYVSKAMRCRWHSSNVRRMSDCPSTRNLNPFFLRYEYKYLD